MTRLGCDLGSCGSRLLVVTYRDEPTGVSFRACWRPWHRRMARTALARRAAILAAGHDWHGPGSRGGDGS